MPVLCKPDMVYKLDRQELYLNDNSLRGGQSRRSWGLASVEQRIDASSAGGELVFHVFGAIAHFERRLISEHARDGIAATRKRGRGLSARRSTGKLSQPHRPLWRLA